jgi:hypothetical protein
VSGSGHSLTLICVSDAHMYDREFGLNLREYETYASHEAGDLR